MLAGIQPSDLCDIKVHSVSLGEGIKGFVYVSKKNVSHVFISESLCSESIKETLAHEIYHLKHDKSFYGIGLDRQHDESEKKANEFAALNTKRLSTLLNATTI